MDEKLKEKAILKFKNCYGKSPQDMGFYCIDIYKRQGVFLYAETEKALKSYKRGQNHIRTIIPITLLVSMVCFFCAVKIILCDITQGRNINLIYIPLGILILLLIVCFGETFFLQKDKKNWKNKVVWIEC